MEDKRPNVVVSFSKVALPYGWLGNMSPYKLQYNGKIWLTAEALFQALRYDDEIIQEEIRMIKSPMGAKMRAKTFKDKMVVVPMTEQDVQNMKLCIRLKLENNPLLKQKLLITKEFEIIEDIGIRNKERDKFWGAKKENGIWIGKNTLGSIWMEVRDEIRKEMA